MHYESNNSIIYKGDEQAKHEIVLLLNGNHFDLISSLSKLFKVFFYTFTIQLIALGQPSKSLISIA
jgi:hypothetical protein